MNDVIISIDKSRIDIPYVHAYLTQSYWAKGRTIEEVKKSIVHSICFGAYLENKQIGFGRVISDQVVFAYVMDVFIDKEHQGQGYGKKFMKEIIEFKELCAIKKWYLKTRDAHKFYRQLGFGAIYDSEMWMNKIIE